MNTPSTPASAFRAADILGVPFVPPAAVTVRASRVRFALRRIHATMAPPPVRILEGLFGVLDHRVLVALCEAGVPDALTGPVEVAAFAERIGADPTMLERLLRFASTRGWVRIDRRGRVRPTRVTAFLRAEHPGGWRSWVDFAGGDEIVAAVGALSARPGVTDPFAEVNGSPFFEWMADHPDRWIAFDRAMGAGGRMHGLTLAGTLDWSDTTTVCDVGGGTGELLATLVDLVPDLEGTVLDLPEVVRRAPPRPRVKVMAGDAFSHVPHGFDTYLLVNVLHDWNDEDATRILRRIAEAAAGRSRVVVVDSDRPTVPEDDVAVAADVLMTALTAGGKERDTAAFTMLGRNAGLRLERSLRLASGDLAHVFRPG